MLNPLPGTADFAADRRRTLLAEAEAHRIAREALAARTPSSAPPGRRDWLRVLRQVARRARTT